MIGVSGTGCEDCVDVVLLRDCCSPPSLQQWVGHEGMTVFMSRQLYGMPNTCGLSIGMDVGRTRVVDAVVYDG